MARSYLPSKVSEIVAIWRKDLSKVFSHSLVYILFIRMELPMLCTCYCV